MSNFDPPSVNAQRMLRKLGAVESLKAVGVSGRAKTYRLIRRLSDLLDVRISTLRDKDALVFDASSGKWVPGVPALRLDQVTDVATYPPEDGAALVWDADREQWGPEFLTPVDQTVEVYSVPWESNGFNGLMRAIGTQGGETPFVNPALMSEGGVVATLSTTNPGGDAYRALDGAASEAHSTNVVGSWWQVDVGEGRTLAVTQFGLMGRDYAHNHPRNFRLEGSNDETTWDTLYTSTAAGPARNAWWSVPIVAAERYRFLRVFNYGNDSSGSPYLVIGEFEVWGALYEEAVAPVRGLSTLPDVDVEGILDGNVLVYDAEDGIWKPGEGGGGGGGGLTLLYERVWSSDGYTGLFDALGTNDGSEAFSNPAISGRIAVSQSSIHSGATAERAVDHSNNEVSGSVSTANIAGSWWQVDFLGRRIAVNRFAIQSRSAGNQIPRNFTLQGSDDGVTWVDLVAITGGGPSGNNTWWSTSVPSGSTWRYLRILQTGVNSNSAYWHCLGEVEFWGELYVDNRPPLATLPDVDVSGVADGNALIYDAETSKWRPGEGGGGGGGEGTPTTGVALSRRLSNMPSASGVRTITFDTVDRAEVGYTVDAGAGTITVEHAGWYALYGSVRLASTVNSPHLLRIAVDSGDIIRSMEPTVSAVGVACSGITHLAAGTVLRLEYYTGSNTTVSFDPARPLTSLVIARLGSGGGPTIKDRRWTKATTDVSLDEFNGSSIDVAWTYAAHASIPALPSLARPRYVQGAGVLSVKYGPETGVGGGTGDGATGRHHAILRPLSGAGGSMSVGDAFYCAFTPLVRANSNHRMCGLVLSTTDDSSGNQLYFRWWTGGSIGARSMVSLGGDTQPAGNNDYAYGAQVQNSPVYQRLVRLSSTTWRSDVSNDGVSWILGNAALTWAYEPTHVGFADSNWNTNTPSVVSYEFLRRQSGVL